MKALPALEDTLLGRSKRRRAGTGCTPELRGEQSPGVLAVDRAVSAATCRQIVAYTVGDRSQESACELRANLPSGYRRRATRRDLWLAEEAAFPQRTPRFCGTGRRRNQPRRTLVSAPCGRGRAAWCAGLTPFPRAWSATSKPSIFLSSPTIYASRRQHRIKHYPPLIFCMERETDLTRSILSPWLVTVTCNKLSVVSFS